MIAGLASATDGPNHFSRRDLAGYPTLNYNTRP